MFTGIVEAVGKVQWNEGGRLVVEAPFEDVQDGESIAVNGCCLTVVGARASRPPGVHDEGSPAALRFDLSEETLSRTALSDLERGAAVNLERAMRADGRFGGHIVQGHVDATGELVAISPQDGSTLFRFKAPSEKYLIDKGSVTVDGISLTVIEPVDGEFSVAVIPHTLAHTNLSERKVGDRVNLEFDVLAKYVERLLQVR